jgi:Protein of unknown function (DUF4231)
VGDVGSRESNSGESEDTVADNLSQTAHVTGDAAQSARRGDRPRRGQAELARELHALLDSLADVGSAERRYLVVRWRPQVLLAKRRVDSNRRWYYSWRVPTVVGALLLPPLASPTVEASWARWTALGVSLVVAICTALESTFRFGNRWRLYRRMLDELRSEGWAYAYHTGPYASKAEFTKFVERSEEAIRRYGEEYVADVLVLGAPAQHASLPQNQGETNPAND